MDRPTKQFTTPGGLNVVIKTYLTAREAMPVIDGKTLTDMERSQKLASEAIISIDGATEGLSDKLLDLPIQEYTAILAEITELISDLKPAK
jgi:hypothetical protein